ncbi:MAG: hypothetical protein IH840_03560 [Candidatus Heimdallarchaeota archaeon]|nr:hypothetical protein [Candidatus Heimdallarchaeota archaeon]
MKNYSIVERYDDEEETDILQILRVDQDKTLFTAVPKEGNLLDYLKSRGQKEFVVYEGNFGNEYGVLKSKMGLSSTWVFEIDEKEVAKADIKGVQYYTIKLSDKKKRFSGKTPNLDEVKLKENKGISTCIKFFRDGSSERLNLRVEVECKILPEALLTFGIALDNKYIFDTN